MKSELDTKVSLWTCLGIFILVLILKGDPSKIVDAASTAVTITLALRFLFKKWAWKWFPWLEKLHGIPHIEGKWTGKYKSTWVASNGGFPAEGDVSTTITQPNMSQVKISQSTGESESFSYGETFERREDGSVLLNFSYNNVPDPEFRERSPMNFGSARLHLERNDNGLALTGNYWTDRRSTGKLQLKRS